MNPIDKKRIRIDAIDGRILELLNERGKNVLEIGKLKERLGTAVFAPNRETLLLQKISRQSRGPMPTPAVLGVFQEIVHACRNMQKRLRIAYLGPEATFTHQAAIKSFGHYADFVACRSISDVFNDVEKGRADYGVVPIENSNEGVVNHTLDTFIESDLKICAEVQLPITH